MRNRNIYFFLLVVAVTVLTIAFYFKYSASVQNARITNATSTQASVPQESPSAYPAEQINMPAFVPGLRDSVSNVFASQEFKEKGKTKIGNRIETQYIVQTGSSMKGEVPKQIIVSSPYSDLDLQSGKLYQFFANYDANHNWYTIVGAYMAPPPVIDR